jgi:toxin ParE1/3/4
VPKQVVYSPQATSQLEDLEAYLANRFYPDSAERFVRRIKQACDSLGLFPERGKDRSDLARGVRMIAFERRATIYFEIMQDRVTILTISYGGRLPKIR